MIEYKVTGSTQRTQNFLKSLSSASDIYGQLEDIAQRGVEALSAATPVDSGLTSSSWSYEVEQSNGGVTIYWTNANDNEGENIAIMLQYGHGTGTGGYVSGRDYINPAIQPIFDQIADDVWKKVTSL